jgi:hypothetical protein
MDEQIQANALDNSASDVSARDDQIVVLQVLQVKERNFDQLLRKFIEQRELVRDVVNETINEVLAENSGFFGTFIVAFRGRKVPPKHGAKLDTLLEYEILLDERIKQMTDDFEKVYELNAKAKKDADDQNILNLRKRAIAILEKERDNSRLIEAEKACSDYFQEYQAKNQEEDAIAAQLKSGKKKAAPTKASKVKLEERIAANS